MQQQLAEQGSEAIAGTPEQFTAFLDVEIKKWAAAVKSAGAKID
jgi:tripartite-type tricarboxylate transporter receptor subunit TctC